MRDLQRRIHAIEAAQVRRTRRMIAVIAAENGLTYDELREEAEQFLAQPLADQLAEVDRLLAEREAAGLPWDEAENIKHTLVREYRP